MQSLSCVQKTILNILKSGQTPTHIGFIMDGNRRYAKKNRYKSTYEGHVQGVKSLKKCLLICKQLSIREISLFCFSVENFNRSKEEVQGLMALCMETFQEMSGMSEMLLRNQIKVNIVGRKEMLRQDVRDALQKIQTRTKNFDKIIVNLCFAYDSSHQIQTSISNMTQPHPQPQAQTYKNFINGLQIKSHLDILVRTANQYRLSNFMLPQAAYAYICILKESWPEINLGSFCRILLGFNYYYKDIMRNKMRILARLQQDQSMGVSKEDDEKQRLISHSQHNTNGNQDMLSRNLKKTE